MVRGGQAGQAAGAWWLINPLRVWSHFHQHRHLLMQLVRREVLARYRGSWLGPLWSLLTPLLMLAVYTFVFSVVFQARWGGDGEVSRLQFALSAFGSITLFNLFAETINSSTGLILGNPNYVKRVVFPLEILPLAKFLACGVQSLFGLAIFLAAVLIVNGSLPWTLVLLPLVVLPLVLLSLGLAFFLSSLGVFVRDVNNVVGLATTMLLFVSPVFYPLSNLPDELRRLLCINPLAPIIESFRQVTLQGEVPDWELWCLVALLSAAICLAGLAWFMKSKNAFADVV